ncbi:MAG: universal stress protein [Solirubrobacterales bacterium]
MSFRHPFLRSPRTGTASALEEPRKTTAQAQALFRNVLCAVNGSRGSLVAVNQALALSDEESELTFLAVCSGEAEGRGLERDHGEAALTAARARASLAGIASRGSLLESAYPSRAIVERAREHDLLVVGAHGGKGTEELMLGRTATAVAHRPERAVLIARRPPSRAQFPSSLLFTTDGSPSSWAGARIASRLGGKAHPHVRVVYVPEDSDPLRYQQVLRQVELIEAEIDVPVRVLHKSGAIPGRICQAAESSHSSLIVIGRGTGATRALSQASEMVVHHAPCSVLVVPPELGKNPGGTGRD